MKNPKVKQELVATINLAPLSMVAKRRFLDAVKLYLGRSLNSRKSLSLSVKIGSGDGDQKLAAILFSASSTSAICCGAPEIIVRYLSKKEGVEESTPPTPPKALKSAAEEVSLQAAVRIVTAWMIALVRSNQSLAKKTDIFTQFEIDLLKQKPQALVAGYLRIEAIALMRYCGGGSAPVIGFDLPSLPSPEEWGRAQAKPTPPDTSIENAKIKGRVGDLRTKAPTAKRKLFKNEQKAAFQGSPDEDRLLMIQVALSSIQQEKLFKALSRRKKDGAFYFRAKDSESLLQTRLSRIIRATLKQSGKTAQALVTICLEVQSGVSSRRLIEELIAAGAIRDHIERIEYGYHSGSLVGALRFCEVKNVGSKKTPVYQRLDSRELISFVPKPVAVCNKIF